MKSFLFDISALCSHFPSNDLCGSKNLLAGECLSGCALFACMGGDIQETIYYNHEKYN